MAEATQNVVQASEAEQTTDYEVLYKEQQARLQKAEEEARNLRKGYNKFKAIAKEKEQDEIDQPDQLEMMRQIAREELMTSTVEQERRKLEDMNLKMARDLKEAKLALANKAPTKSASGAGSSGVEVQDNYLSPDQLANLKSRGWDDARIEAFKKNRQNLPPNILPR